MTAQIPDTYTFNNKKYDFIAKSGPLGFDPTDYGLKPNASSTACWRGYWCDYVVRRSRLILKNLLIYNADGYYPPFNGVEPSSIGSSGKVVYSEKRGHVMYRVNLEMDYTGAIVVGRGFISNYYVHGGFQRAWAFKEVKELVFENGKVVEVKDHSNEVKAIRKLYDEDPFKFLDDLTYDLSYDDTPAFLRDDSRPRSYKMWPWWLIP